MSFEDSVAVLEMYGLSVEDSGDYTCEARNAAGSASSSTSLKVKGQALLRLHPAHQLLSHRVLLLGGKLLSRSVLKLFKDPILENGRDVFSLSPTG